MAYTKSFPRAIRAYPNTIAVQDGNVESLLRTAAHVYRFLDSSFMVGVHADDYRSIAETLGRRFMFGDVHDPWELNTVPDKMVDSVLSFDLHSLDDWQDRVRGIFERLHEGGVLFMYEKHPKRGGGMDPLLLVQFLIESVGFEVLEYTATADVFGGYYVAARKVS